MNEPRVSYWSGMVFLMVCLLLGLLVIVLAEARSGLLIPLWTFVVLFVALMVTLFAQFVDRLSTRVRRAGFVLQVLLAATLVFTAPTAGWLPILLVFVAAISPHVVPMSGTVAVVIFNSVVIAVATGRFAETEEAVLSAGLYALLQLAAARASAASLREAEIRERLTEAHAELQAATAMREETSRADERVRIARELHDLLGHQLTALTLELETASHRTGEQADQHVDRARGIARELLADVRSTVGELRRRSPDLREMLGRFSRVPTPRVRITVAQEVAPEEDQTLALVRITQEIVTNSIRHSGATELSIDIGTED